MQARVRRFPDVHLFKTTLSCVSFLFKPKLRRSLSTHSFHHFLPLPLGRMPSAHRYLHADTHSSLSLQWWKNILLKLRIHISSFFFQFSVNVTDLGTPPLHCPQPANVTVSVLRNKYAPVISDLPATISLNQTAPVGTRVYVVNATDNDTVAPYNTLSYQVRPPAISLSSHFTSLFPCSHRSDVFPIIWAFHLSYQSK